MRKILLYFLLILPLASCSVGFYEPTPPPLPPPPPIQELITNIKVGGPYGGIVAVVVNNELRAGNYNGPTLAVAEGNYINEVIPPQECLGYIDGPYIMDTPYGRDIAFVDGPYITTTLNGPVLAFMDGVVDNIAGGLGAIYMLYYY